MPFQSLIVPRNYLPILFASLLYLQAMPAHGACTCIQNGWSSLFLTYNWEDMPGTVISTETTETLAESSFSIGSCPYKEAVPPKKTCQANGGSSTVSKWVITGSIDAALWGLSVARTESVDYSADCASSMIISSWCTCCHMKSGLAFNTTTKKMRCRPAATEKRPAICENIISGSKKTFLHVFCNQNLQCTPPTPCTTTSTDSAAE